MKEGPTTFHGETNYYSLHEQVHIFGSRYRGWVVVVIVVTYFQKAGDLNPSPYVPQASALTTEENCDRLSLPFFVHIEFRKNNLRQSTTIFLRAEKIKICI